MTREGVDNKPKAVEQEVQKPILRKWSKNATIGEMYGPAMEVHDADEARAYFEALVLCDDHARPTWNLR